MDGEWDELGAVRNDFADLIESLSPEQLDGSTLCEGWTPRHVLAHVVWHAEMRLPSFVLAMGRSRFDFEQAAHRGALEGAQRPVNELTAALRANATRKGAVPGTPQSGLVTDTAIHTQDVRRPLKLDGALTAKTVRTVLDFLTSHRNAKYVIDPAVLTGLRFRATDIDWEYGIGPAVEGPGEAIFMSLARRPAASDLSGDGLDILRTRLSG